MLKQAWETNIDCNCFKSALLSTCLKLSVAGEGGVENRVPRLEDKILCRDAGVLKGIVIHSNLRMKMNRKKRIHGGIWLIIRIVNVNAQIFE